MRTERGTLVRLDDSFGWDEDDTVTLVSITSIPYEFFVLGLCFENFRKFVKSLTQTRLEDKKVELTPLERLVLLQDVVTS